MTRDELLAEFREAADDSVAPYAWGDPRALHMLSEGQDKFCEETGYFTDSSTYEITTVAGVVDYDLDPRIIEVLEVWDGQRKLGKFSQTDRPLASTLGEPRLPQHWQADRETGKLTLNEPPLADLVLTLRVQRYSVTPFYKSGNPEIPARFHRAMVEYAASKAFNDHDRERQDPVKAADHKANFDDYCADGRKALARREGFQPQVAPNPAYVV